MIPVHMDTQLRFAHETPSLAGRTNKFLLFGGGALQLHSQERIFGGESQVGFLHARKARLAGLDHTARLLPEEGQLEFWELAVHRFFFDGKENDEKGPSSVGMLYCSISYENFRVKKC
jgi:hypothetical protein